MGIELGSIVEGKVTGVTKFGAFVSLPEGKSGLVHISEISNTYVSEVSDFVKVGQEVKVKVLSINEAGKINLSIKKAEEQPKQATARPYVPKAQPKSEQPAYSQRTAANPPSDNQDFEDRLKKFMQESDSRIADNRRYSEHKQRSRRR